MVWNIFGCHNWGIAHYHIVSRGYRSCWTFYTTQGKEWYDSDVSSAKVEKSHVDQPFHIISLGLPENSYLVLWSACAAEMPPKRVGHYIHPGGHTWLSGSLKGRNLLGKECWVPEAENKEHLGPQSLLVPKGRGCGRSSWACYRRKECPRPLTGTNQKVPGHWSPRTQHVTGPAYLHPATPPRY